ncbi:hypothetical protein [Xylocopilactobacillus apis]|uniref:Chemotaxis protein n=1 Tax=Xylocopilactobacillus apis TaxID=2932183 RepID=A0AAU9DLG2_9LACO|nr:hypothetical protein [Xylocopilactobacillus apis]BDR56404.1 hypothetical protein KIMC2_09660 [Xylocopilactobacillus apis]
MKIKNLIIISGISLAGYKIYEFFSNKDNIDWINELSESSQTVLDKYKKLNDKIKILQKENNSIVMPVVKDLTKKINEFVYTENFEIQEINDHLQSIIHLLTK